MYDPEVSLELERDLEKDKLLLFKIQQRLGKNHSYTQRVELMNEILNSITKKEIELMNAFDENNKNNLNKEIDELLEIANELLEKL